MVVTHTAHDTRTDTHSNNDGKVWNPSSEFAPFSEFPRAIRGFNDQIIQHKGEDHFYSQTLPIGQLLVGLLRL